MGLTLFNMAVPSMLMAQCGWIPTYMATPIILDCIPPGCIDIIEEQLHPKEKKVLEGFESSFYEKYFCEPENRKEYLRLRKDDPKDKFLFLSAQESRNEILDPRLKSQLLSDINKNYDLKYKVVRSYNEICQEIEQASKLGKLSNVLIDANGNKAGLHIAGPPGESKSYIYPGRQDFLECFKGLALSGKITLLDCSSGIARNGDPKESIAQKFATAAKRTVIAPTSQCYPSRVEVPSSDDFEVFHEDLNDKTSDPKQKNIFKIFHPIYKKCTSIFKDKIHPREQAAIDTIKDAFSKKSTLVQPTEFDHLQNVLGFCKDDPKEKFLFLSAEEPLNGGLDPTLKSKFLSDINKKYDLKYKVVKSYNEICQEIEQASKIGKLSNVLIDAYRYNAAIHIAGPLGELSSQIHQRREFLKCFKGLDPSGRITLLGSSTGAATHGDPQENIAQKIATATNRVVIAPTGQCYPSEIEMQSLDDFLPGGARGLRGGSPFLEYGTTKMHQREEALIVPFLAR